MGTKEQTEMLLKHEGYRQHPYKCTAKKLTIAIGRNLEDVGISYTEAMFLLKNDIEECQKDLVKIFPKFDLLPENIQDVLVNMRFQLGPNRFRKFKKMIGAVKQFDFDKMTIEMKDSLWYRQVTNRADELIAIVRNH